MKLVRSVGTNKFVSYKSDTDYKRPLCWALITVGYRRKVELTYYLLANRRAVQEPMRTVKAAHARIEELERQAAGAVPASEVMA